MTHLLPENPHKNASDDYILLHPGTAQYIWFPDIYIGQLHPLYPATVEYICIPDIFIGALHLLSPSLGTVCLLKRQGVAAAVLQTPLSLIHWLVKSSFSSNSVKHQKSLTIRASELTFLHNVHIQFCVICHVSCVICHVSCVMCHIFFYRLAEQVDGWSVINVAYPV